MGQEKNVVIRLVRNRSCPALRTVQYFPEDPRTQSQYSIFRLPYEYGSAEEEAERGEVEVLNEEMLRGCLSTYYNVQSCNLRHITIE